MRHIFRGRAGAALAFLLGAMIATAGTATAAKLITGKQIKDGSISAKDLSKAVQAQLKKTGATGPAGPAGPAGAPGAKGDPGTNVESAPPMLRRTPGGSVTVPPRPEPRGTGHARVRRIEAPRADDRRRTARRQRSGFGETSPTR